MTMEKNVNFIQWNINRTCNYDCSYCASGTRKFSLRKDPSPFDILRGLKNGLTGQWKIQFCGSGEPFLTPGFLEIVKELVEAGHRVGVITNFSFPLGTIYKFIKIAGENLAGFGVSLHLEYAAPDEFLAKALKVKKLIGDNLYVNSVAQKERLPELEKIAKMFRDNDMFFNLQPERRSVEKVRTGKGLLVNYSKKELDIIGQSVGSVFSKENLEFKGQLCWAGAKQFIVAEDGNAWRCAPARRDRLESGYLGNLADGTFKLKNKPEPCRSRYCFCSTPLIENRKR